MSETEKRVLAIGGIYVDINCYHYPHDGSLRAEVEFDGQDYETIAGGSGVNFGRLCVALGLHTTFVGKVGNDAMGRFAMELLQDAGIKPALAIDSKVGTNVAMNFVNDTGATIMPGVGNANQALGPDDVLHKALPLLTEMIICILGSCLKLKKFRTREDLTGLPLDEVMPASELGASRSLVASLVRGSQAILLGRHDLPHRRRPHGPRRGAHVAPAAGARVEGVHPRARRRRHRAAARGAPHEAPRRPRPAHRPL